MTIPDTPVSTPKPVSTPIPEPYQYVQEFIGTDAAYLEEIDKDFVCALDALAQAMMEYEAALEYSMTDEQYAYIEQIMYAYYMEMESYLLQGEQFTQIGNMDVSGAFMDEYMPQYINYLYREADVISEFARIYSKEEVKDALANHTASELEEMLSMGGGAGDLIIYEISEETAQRLYDNTQELFSLIDDMNTWATELMADPELSGYFRQKGGMSMDNTTIIKQSDPENILWKLFRIWVEDVEIPFEADKRMLLYLKENTISEE